MNHTYKPSGKVSFLFVPVFLIMLFITVLSAFVCIFCIHFSPYSVFDVLILIIATGGIAKYGALWCVKCGKVRNPVFSSLCGIVSALFYWYLLIIFYLPVKEMFTMKSFYLLNAPPPKLLQSFRFKELLQSFSLLKNNGSMVTGKKGDVFFTIPGNISVIMLSIACIITVIYFAAEFYQAGCCPFCENSRQWMKKIMLTYTLPEDMDLFLSKLLLGDYKVLSFLEPLYEVNVNHYMVSLYFNNTKDQFYISLSHMENSGSTDKKTGKTLFIENELARYLEIDRETGRSMLLQKTGQTEDVSVRIVTDETKRKEKRWMAFNWVIGILAILLCVFGIFKLGNNLQEFLFKGGFFYIVLIFFINAIRFIRSMQKEMVITSTEDRYAHDGTKKSLARETETPAMFKLFYLFMMLSAVALFILCIAMTGMLA